jgi:hypothetical protein
VLAIYLVRPSAPQHKGTTALDAAGQPVAAAVEAQQP